MVSEQGWGSGSPEDLPPELLAEIADALQPVADELALEEIADAIEQGNEDEQIRLMLERMQQQYPDVYAWLKHYAVTNGIMFNTERIYYHITHVEANGEELSDELWAMRSFCGQIFKIISLGGFQDKEKIDIQIEIAMLEGLTARQRAFLTQYADEMLGGPSIETLTPEQRHSRLVGYALADIENRLDFILVEKDIQLFTEFVTSHFAVASEDPLLTELWMSYMYNRIFRKKGVEAPRVSQSLIAILHKLRIDPTEFESYVAQIDALLDGDEV